MRWSYGVTTVPSRLGNLLPKTLRSLRGAGFDRPRLFVDGVRPEDAPAYAVLGGEGKELEVTTRYPKVRVHGNWVLSIYELFLRDPTADRYALFQDDLLAVKNLRTYLECSPYPERGYLNLYTAPSNQKLADGEGWYESHQHGRGALALIFSRPALLTLLASDHLLTRPLHPIRGWRCVDGGVIESMKKVKAEDGTKAPWREWVHNPSLVYHTGHVSSFDKNKRSLGESDSFNPYTWPEYYLQSSFPGEDFDAESLIGGLPYSLGPPPVEGSTYWRGEAEALRRAVDEDKERLRCATLGRDRSRFAKYLREYELKLKEAEGKLADCLRAEARAGKSAVD